MRISPTVETPVPTTNRLPGPTENRATVSPESSLARTSDPDPNRTLIVEPSANRRTLTETRPSIGVTVIDPMPGAGGSD